MIQLLTCCFPGLHRAIDNLCSLRHLQLRCVALEWIAAGGRNSAGGNEQPRPGDVAVFDRLFDSHIAVPGAFRLHIAESSEPLLQRTANRNRRSSSAQRSWIFQNVGVISSLGWILTLQEYVGMRVDQSGKQSSSREINGGCAGWNLRAACVRDALDAIAANNDQLIVFDCVGLAIDQSASPNDRDRCRI